MRNVWLIALREYLENARTKGFWIGILLVPGLIFVGVQVPQFLEEKALSQRHFVLVDQSERFEEPIMTAVRHDYRGRVREVLEKHLREHAREGPGEAREAALQAMPERVGDEAEWERYLEERIEPLLKEEAPAFARPEPLFRRVPLEVLGIEDTREISAIAEQLKPYLRGERSFEFGSGEPTLFAAILIPPAVEGEDAEPVQYWAGNLADNRLQRVVARTMNELVREQAYTERGLDPRVVEEVRALTVPMTNLNPRKEAGSEEVSTADYIRQFAPSAFVYLLWIALFAVSQMLLNNIIEEKSNRIIEVLLSSVTPWELMMGKLIGIGGIGLTLVGVWVSIAVLILIGHGAGGGEAEVVAASLDVLSSSGLIPAFLGYFLLGYFIYACLFLTIGSLFDTIKEAQNWTGPLMMVMIIPLLTLAFIPRDPNGTLAVTLSWIPIFTPFVMMNRISADPGLGQILGTLLLCMGFVLVEIWVASRIFRVAILRTGQAPRFRELLRWIVKRE